MLYGDEEEISSAISAPVNKVVVKYTPSSYKASTLNLNFGEAENVTTSMSAAPRYDTIYSYQPSTYVASKYTASKYSASSATKVSQTLYVKTISGTYTEYSLNGSLWANYQASSYTKETYVASSYVASSLVKKALTYDYTASSYTKSALTAKPVEIQLGTITTKNMTILTA